MTGSLGRKVRARTRQNWPGPVPALPQQLTKLPVGVELADALVFAELGDVEIAVVVLHGVADVAELSRLGAGLAAELAQLARRLAGLHVRNGIDAQAVVVRIADEQVAVAVDAEAAGPAVAVVGRGPGRAEVMAVAVEDLDAGGEIDDVEAVLAVDGDGAGLDEVAVLHAPVTPDQFRLRVRPAAARAGQHQAEEQNGDSGAREARSSGVSLRRTLYRAAAADRLRPARQDGYCEPRPPRSRS